MSDLPAEIARAWRTDPTLQAFSGQGLAEEIRRRWPAVTGAEMMLAGILAAAEIGAERSRAADGEPAP